MGKIICIFEAGGVEDDWVHHHHRYFFFGTSVYPFIWGNEANVQREFYEHRWRPGADNSKAKYPAVSSGPNTNNNQISTLYMRDGSYLRLKNAEIGYSLPQKWI